MKLNETDVPFNMISERIKWMEEEQEKIYKKWEIYYFCFL